MNNNKTVKRISSTLILSFLAMVVNYAISFVLTRYITETIGVEAYGFVTLAKTISNYGIVISSCLNAYAARFVTIAYYEENINKAKRYLSSVVLSNLGLLCIVCIIEIFAIWKLERIIVIPQYLVPDVKILFALDITNYMLLVLANCFSVAAYIKDRLSLIEATRLLAYTSEAIILIVLFSHFPPKIYYVGIGLLGSTFIIGWLFFVLLRRLTPELVVSLSSFSWKAVKELVYSGFWNSLNSIGNMLNSGLDLLVSNLLLSALMMGQLSIVKTISTIVSTLISLMGKPFHPMLLKKYSEKNIHSLVGVLIYEIKFSGYFSNMLFAGLICFGTSYFKLWVPQQNEDILNRIMIVTVIGLLFEGTIYPLFYIYTLTLQNRIPCIVTIFSGLLNVLGMYLLLKHTTLGLYAVVGTTTVLGFLTYLVFTPIYSSKCIGLKWNTFYPTIARVLISACIITITLKLAFRLYMPDTWIKLSLCAIVSCLVGAPIHIICVFGPNDFKKLKNNKR